MNNEEPLEAVIEEIQFVAVAKPAEKKYQSGGRKCCIVGCRNNYKRKRTGITFHKFPINDCSRKSWINCINNLNGQDIVPDEKQVLCCEHFANNCFQKQFSFSTTTLKKDSIPTIFPKIDLSETSNLEILFDNDYVQKIKENSNYINVAHKSNLLVANKKLRIANAKLQRKIEYCNSKLKILRNSKSYLRKKTLKLEDQLKTLRNSITAEEKKVTLSKILPEEEQNILHKINCAKAGVDYVEEVRTFALTLHSYSPKAYTYVRKLAQNRLPSVRTLREWRNDSSGLTKKHLAFK